MSETPSSIDQCRSASFGAALEAARKARSLSIIDVCKTLLLSDTQVRGLETGSFSSFYSSEYARSAARKYATFLEVPYSLEESSGDGEATEVHSYALPDNSEKIFPSIKSRTPGSRPKIYLILSVSLLGFAYLIAAYNSAHKRLLASEDLKEGMLSAHVELGKAAEPISAGDDKSEAKSVQAPVSQPDSLPTDGTSTDRAHRIWLVVKMPAFIKVTDGRGVVVFERHVQFDPGQRIYGVPPFKVLVSSDDAVEIYYRGARIRPQNKSYDGIDVTIN